MNNKHIYLVTNFSKKKLIKIKQYAKLNIGYIQYRDKNCSDQEFVQNSNLIYQLISKYKVKFIINDRVHLLDQIDCDGFHVGQKDGDHIILRKKYPNHIIGISANNYNQAKKAISDGANLLGVGAMFPTNTKKDAILCSMNELKKMKKFSSKIIVIGGLNDQNITKIEKKYFSFAAFSSFLLNHKNPEKALNNITYKINKSF